MTLSQSFTRYTLPVILKRFEMPERGEAGSDIFVGQNPETRDSQYSINYDINEDMKAPGKTVKEILLNQPEDRIKPFNKLHEVIMKNLPKGFEAGTGYGGVGYVVPHTIYPNGYHCNPQEPLPFAGIHSRKDSINFYHMGIYADAK